MSIEKESCSKVTRILSIYDDLNKGYVVNKQEAAIKFAVSEKAIQRDLDDLRAYLDYQSTYENGDSASIDYDRSKKGYTISRGSSWLTQEEVLAIAKVLLESRTFTKKEMELLLDKLISQCSPDARKHVREVILNERFHYLPVAHAQPLLKKLWDISMAIREQRLMEVSYLKQGSISSVQRTLEPCGLIFSDFYFYVIAYIKDSGYDFPAVYRLDRIESYTITNEHFRIYEAKRFQEGEFRKRVQFMTAGSLIRIRFRFWGPSLDAVLDRLPTAEVIERDDEKAVVEAEVFGEGVKMWLLSQAEFLEVLKPESFRQEMKNTLQRMLDNYK